MHDDYFSNARLLLMHYCKSGRKEKNGYSASFDRNFQNYCILPSTLLFRFGQFLSWQCTTLFLVSYMFCSDIKKPKNVSSHEGNCKFFDFHYVPL